MARQYDDKKSFHFSTHPIGGAKDIYSGGFTAADHMRLRNTIQDLKGKVMVCYYDQPEIRELYSDWNIEEYTCRSKVRHRELGEKLEEKTELIIMNYKPEKSQMSMF